MAVILKNDNQINRIVCKLPGVRAEVRGHADIIAALANANLAPHHNTGSRPKGQVAKHRITVSRQKVKFGRIDWFVNLIGPAAAAIEGGHPHNFTGRPVAPLRILERAWRAHAGV